MAKQTTPLSFVNKTGDGVIKVRTNSQTIIDFLLDLGYHIATPDEYKQALRKACAADKQVAEKQNLV